MNNPNFRLALIGLAAGVLLALVIAPQTRWLVKSQILPPSLAGNYEQQKKRFVQDHLNDYPVQLAGQTTSDETQVQYARSLVARFPQNASLRANILRYAMGKFHLYRDEDNLLQGNSIPAHQVDPNSPPPTPAELAAFDADAAAGERLDPNNAYFPLMRTFGLFAAHRDADALAAVQRASEKPLWREYSEDEVEGHWRINDGIYGGREALASWAISASVLFPHYQRLRQIARIVTYKAILQEQAGHREAGLALRRQIMRCGELMRDQSQSVIGNLVGLAICSVARSRPGGGPPYKRVRGESLEQGAQKRLDAYCAYVTRIGHPDAAAEARAQYESDERMRHLITGGLTFGSQMEKLTRLTVGLVAGWILFPNIVTTLLLGLAAAVLCHLPQIRERRPLPAGSSFGIWGIVVIVLLLAALFVNTPAENFPVEAALLLLAPLLLAGLAARFSPRLRRPLVQSLRASLCLLGAVWVVSGLLAWQMHGGGEILTTLREMVSLSGENTSYTSSPETRIAQTPALFGLAFGLAVPLLLTLILSLVARVRRVPVSVGLLEGFRVAMPPLVCLLMLCYGVLILWTVRQEAKVNYGLERSLHGEGQYVAELTGQKWP